MCFFNLRSAASYLVVSLLLTPIISTGFSQEFPVTPSSFEKAKKLALVKVYFDHRLDFYCNCTFNADKSVNPESCGYQPRKNANRGKQIEWEHVVPAETLGGHLACWQNREQFPKCRRSSGTLLSGRDCCLRVDPTFKKAHNDLMNLTPAVGELNGDRSNFQYGIIDSEERVYGDCDFEVDFSNKVAEPMSEIRGDIARIYLYMFYIHGFPLGEDQQQLLVQWMKDDPISDWELDRNRRILEIQFIE